MTASPDFASSAFTVLTALSVVLVGLVLLYLAAKRFLGRGLARATDHPIRVLANQFVGVKKNVALVEVPGSVLVLGLTSERITLLDKIDDPVLLDRLRAQESREEKSFSRQLTKLSTRLRTFNESR